MCGKLPPKWHPTGAQPRSHAPTRRARGHVRAPTPACRTREQACAPTHTHRTHTPPGGARPPPPPHTHTQVGPDCAHNVSLLRRCLYCLGGTPGKNPKGVPRVAPSGGAPHPPVSVTKPPPRWGQIALAKTAPSQTDTQPRTRTDAQPPAQNISNCNKKRARTHGRPRCARTDFRSLIDKKSGAQN